MPIPAVRALFALVALLLATAIAQAQPTYDLLLKGGHVIDPRNGIDGPMDVAVTGGRIAAVRAGIDPGAARQVVDVAGLYVTPGLIDIHVHVFATTGVKGAWAGDNSVLPDGFSFRTGVTTMVDAGSSGWRNFEDFRRTVIDRASTRVLAMLNIAGFGMLTDVPEQNVHDMDARATADMALRHKDVVVGIKSAHYQGPEWISVDRAIEAGTAANVPVMVDFGYFREERPYHQLVTTRLRPGDITTHMFRGPVPYIGADGAVLAYLKRARGRGVVFDVGHGGGSFVFRTMVPAVAQGFYPDTISTDLHTGSMNAGMQDMLTTMSKFLVAGMPLAQVIRASTDAPAKVIKRPGLGHLSVGAEADIAVLRVMEGRFGYADGARGTMTGDKRLLCELTLREGRVAWDWNARTGTDYRKLPPTYGVRDVDRVIVP
ncbi:amidohydrolase [Luteitalea sp. TBR-22]|uniref:amidohydrolase/deacetylase family metallohydrolase n=1 Tax=Luteitalea sp. TBR-22 TaxID=2802971 RepID=UPI001AF7672E|nr:amidohydrolase/deacetylase family metallohydrolase [Luteitalea sp. TBR-22]BCS35908.1 amidohydrolase [Luteitalea sp. TBR-22]